MFGKSAAQVGSRIRQTREHIFARQFVSNYVGAEHISREDVIEKHTTKFASTFFGDNNGKVVVVVDGKELLELIM